jgi:hypothetical protein
MTAVADPFEVVTEPVAEPAPAPTKAQGKSKAQALYAEAESVLRAKYAEEFDAILDGLYARDGVTRKRRLSAEQRAEVERQEAEAKAAAKIEEMLAKYPSLMDKFSG